MIGPDDMDAMRPESPMPRPERSKEHAAIEGAARAIEEYLVALNDSPRLFWSSARKRDITELIVRMPGALRGLAAYVEHLEAARPKRCAGWHAGWRAAQEAAAQLVEGRPLPESPEHYTHWPEVGRGDAANDSDRVFLARNTAAAIRAMRPEDQP